MRMWPDENGQFAKLEKGEFNLTTNMVAYDHRGKVVHAVQYEHVFKRGVWVQADVHMCL